MNPQKRQKIYQSIHIENLELLCWRTLRKSFGEFFRWRKLVNSTIVDLIWPSYQITNCLPEFKESLHSNEIKETCEIIKCLIFDKDEFQLVTPDMTPLGRKLIHRWCDALHLIHVTKNQGVQIRKPKRWCFPDYCTQKNQAFCESCGISGDFSPILTNVFANIELCQDCVNEVVEKIGMINGDKWRIVNPTIIKS